MPRPKTKEELLELSESNFEKLNEIIEKMEHAEQRKDFPPGSLNRNIRDVLCHLHHWHLMMMEWYNIGMSGSKPEMPAKGYTWKTVPELNKWIWDYYGNTSLEKAKKSIKESYSQLRKIIIKHTNDELFEKKRYKWT
ncbi:MAG: ClbS/DfsB family four-helix bundle protein, partial [Bacteroidota bacterium]